MSKQILFKEDAHAKLKKGVDTLANAVRTTLGPRGKVCVFERGTVMFSLDGVTVAKQIQLKDHGEQMGVSLAQKIAAKTDQQAGDGTSTATILAQAILSEGLKALNAGIDHTKMRDGMRKAEELAVKTIEKLAKPVKGEQDIANVATISSRDEEVGKMIAGLMKKLGSDATITVEEGQVMGLHKEEAQGMEIDKGYGGVPYFMTNQERAEAVLEDPLILVTAQTIMSNQDIVKLMGKVLQASEKKTFLVIADDVKGEALTTMVLTKLQGGLCSVKINAPGFGDDKTEQLKDIAEVVGATFVSEDTGLKVEDVEVSDLGKAKKVIIKEGKTVIIGGAGKKKDISARVKFIQEQIKLEKSDYERELKEKRVAKLKGGVAVIKVGTPSTEETSEKRYRIEDAVRASKSAIEEGVVPGAGMSFIAGASAIQWELINNEKDSSVRMGMEIIKEALSEPARQIILNAGYKPDAILANVKDNHGWDSKEGEYCDLIKRGIINPAKVDRVALTNAMSIASLFLITETLIVNSPSDNDKKKDNN